MQGLRQRGDEEGEEEGEVVVAWRRAQQKWRAAGDAQRHMSWLRSRERQGVGISLQ